MTHERQGPLTNQMQPIASQRRWQPYTLLAEGTSLAHFAFVIFAIAGGLLLPLRPELIWVHLPVVAWSALVNLLNWTCPLTPLEKYFRRRAGLQSYAGGFLFHHFGSLVSSRGMPRQMDWIVGIGILVWNAVVYGGVYLLLTGPAGSAGW
ncbi:MAG: DUF2784 domain-containing protein [Bacillota bacterium]